MKRPPANDRPLVRESVVFRLSEDRVKLRIALFIAVAALTLASLGYGLNALLVQEPGLQEITAHTSSLSCCDDFELYYNLGAGEASPAVEMKAVKALYSEAAAEAYRIFSVEAQPEENWNISYVNSSINQEIQVAPALYRALALCEESGARYHYLAPVYEIYLALFQCEYEYEAAEYDPLANGGLRDFYSGTVTFVNSPEDIRLELLGNNTVRLAVSDAYQSFARQNGITRFIDLFWMKNAFITDYFADILLENGFSRGLLVSCDGFVRNLEDSPQAEFTLALSRRDGAVVSEAQALGFTGAISIAYLRDYPMANDRKGSYYVRGDGTILCPYIDTADGMCKSALPEIVASSAQLSCAQIALKLAPFYISDSFDQAAVSELAREGITVYLNR